MTSLKTSFEILLGQRYFHYIILRDIDGYNLHQYWSELSKVNTTEGVLGKIVSSKDQANFSYLSFDIEHRQLVSNYQFTRGETIKAISESNDGNPPYFYDLFGVRIKIDGQNYFVISFPYSGLARVVVENLIKEQGLNKKCDILKLDVPTLIHEGDIKYNGFAMKIISLQVNTHGDPALSSVNLSGDDPLKSTIYLKFLQNSIGKKVFPERCIVNCALENQSAIRAKIHIDNFGNFKFYMHLKAQNLIIIPYFVQCLYTLKCFDKVSINPLYRLEKEDE